MPKQRMTLEKLAIMASERFDNVDEKISGSDKMISSLTSEIHDLKIGQENIILRLDQMVPQFEVKELKKRVSRIENHLNLDN